MRNINEIALDIRKEWVNTNPTAKPYLDAMMELKTINDKYYSDTARSIVLYFLSNAGTFRGEKAKQLKQELKQLN